MSRAEFLTWLGDADRRPLVMGVLNVTADSFSDGAQGAQPRAAGAHGHEMVAAGAELIDIGGESPRAGSRRVEAAEQIRRVLPVVEPLSGQVGGKCGLSIDTTRSEVAQAGLDAGVSVINDISGGRDDAEVLR